MFSILAKKKKQYFVKFCKCRFLKWKKQNLLGSMLYIGTIDNRNILSDNIKSTIIELFCK